MNTPRLTAKAERNLASGATTGPGTGLCGTCGRTKEATRLNSVTCRACGAGPDVTMALKVNLEPDVWTALSADAARREITPASLVTHLLTKKYRKP